MRVEGDAGRDREDAILAQLPVDAPEDVLPALGRDVARRLGVAAAIPLGQLFIGRLRAGMRTFVGRPAVAPLMRPLRRSGGLAKAGCGTGRASLDANKLRRREPDKKGCQS
jgi:hypothetical protein